MSESSVSVQFVEGAFYAICQRPPTNREINGITMCATDKREAIHLIRRMPEAAKFFNNFYGLSFNWIEFKLAVGEYPSPFQADLLVEDGINEFVNLTGQALPYSELLPATIGYSEFVLKDNAYNSPQTVELAVTFVLDKMRDNQRIYLHCFSGISRSAMVAALVVGCQKNLNYRHAVDYVRSRRSVAHPHAGLLTLSEANNAIKRLRNGLCNA